MNSYQRANMEKMSSAYDFIAANPGCTVWDICDEFSIVQNTARRILRYLREELYIDHTVGLRSQNGQFPNTYRVTGKGRPEAPPPRPIRGRKVQVKPAKIEKPRAIPECKRVIKKATQIGMAPYRDLPRAFFLPAEVLALGA